MPAKGCHQLSMTLAASVGMPTLECFGCIALIRTGKRPWFQPLDHSRSLASLDLPAQNRCSAAGDAASAGTGTAKDGGPFSTGALTEAATGGNDTG
ncbi:hypothetical protein LH446_10915, partial [Laribacter hongkongensis]|nr:hypothetical protein [Laribacter hongkongensis]